MNVCIKRPHDWGVQLTIFQNVGFHEVIWWVKSTAVSQWEYDKWQTVSRENEMRPQTAYSQAAGRGISKEKTRRQIRNWGFWPFKRTAPMRLFFDVRCNGSARLRLDWIHCVCGTGISVPSEYTCSERKMFINLIYYYHFHHAKRLTTSVLEAFL